MKKTERILRPVKRIHGGIRLDHRKNTAEIESVVMPAPGIVCIPMLQHIGKPAMPIVKQGDNVFVGTLIAEADGNISTPMHASVSGTVKEITIKNLNGRPCECVVIESDGQMTPDPELKPFKILSSGDIAKAAGLCGLVGLGGAGFPTNVKLTPPEGKTIDTLIVNAAECEPYITSDYRECMENYNDVINGVYMLKSALDIERVIICVENNKPKAIEKLYAVATDHRDFNDTVKLMKLPSKYPQGAEKVIIYSATGRKLPVGSLPGDIGCIVMNVTSIGALYRFISTGMPLVSKRITVDGDAVTEPKNIIVPIGTKISDILEFVGGIDEDACRITMGGPMMGVSVTDTDAVVEKRNNAILVMKNPKKTVTTACIRCARCAAGCPMGLFPAKVETAYRMSKTDAFEKLNVSYCMECGSCSYICPAKRPLTEVMRIAKSELRRKK